MNRAIKCLHIEDAVDGTFVAIVDCFAVIVCFAVDWGGNGVSVTVVTVFIVVVVGVFSPVIDVDVIAVVVVADDIGVVGNGVVINVVGCLWVEVGRPGSPSQFRVRSA